MPKATERLLAIDWLRGLVMVLMALDHVDHAINRNHAHGDSAAFGDQGPLSVPDFLVRWLTHLCAPTFVLLAGTSVVLSAAHARARGAAPASVDRHLLLRGAILVALELTLVSAYWRVAEGLPRDTLLPVFPQVLWAIGAGLVLMPLVRHLDSRWLIGLAVLLLVVTELVRSATLDAAFDQPLGTALLLTGGPWWIGERTDMPDVIVLYPLLAWLPAMLLGLVLGRRLVAGRLHARTLAVAGLAMLLLFLVVRGIDGFGNMGLHRRDASLVQWLHCSKYPPSISYFALELGLSLLVLALFRRCDRGGARAPGKNPVALLGRVPLFFYLLHLPMIGLLIALGVLPAHGAGSWSSSPFATLVVVLACWPLCAGYDWYRRRFRHGWTRFL
ncbi:MAG TPA: heparan-alpha-glucosaminide N-acetyltransferase domain-containing protein [Planctomycetota bacterium]|nr:heparan-alpha-glucosaminide N-acetyltransferase domain-containing protein [Planctomycetota bacterium]